MLKNPLFILIVVVLVACSHQVRQKQISDQKPVISLGDVENVLREQGFVL